MSSRHISLTRFCILNFLFTCVFAYYPDPNIIFLPFLFSQQHITIILIAFNPNSKKKLFPTNERCVYGKSNWRGEFSEV